MADTETLDALAIKKAEIELKRAEIELAGVNRSVWRDLVSSAPLATVLVALIGLSAAYVSGYLNYSRLELETKRNALQGQVDDLKTQKKSLDSDIARVKKLYDSVSVQYIAQDLLEKARLYASDDAVVNDICKADLQYYYDEGAINENATGRDVVLGVLKEERAALLELVNRIDEGVPQSQLNNPVVEHLDAMVSAIETKKFSTIADASKNDELVVAYLKKASDILDLPFYVSSTLYARICKNGDISPESRKQSIANMQQVRQTRFAIIMTLRSISVATSRLFGFPPVFSPP